MPTPESTPFPAPTSGSATTPTPATPAPISTLTQTQNTTSLNGEELPPDALSKALLIDLYDVTLLQNEEEKQKLIVEARGFADTVRTESNHDARMNNGPVPSITAPGDGNWLSLPLNLGGSSSSNRTVPIVVEQGSAGCHPVQFASCLGARASMQGNHIATSLTYPDVVDPIGLVGVFDGHRGNAASRFVKTHIEGYLTREFKANHEAAPITKDDDIYAGCILALHNAFLKIDEAYLQVTESVHKNPLGDGTTAIVGLIVHNKLIVANLGNSRAILIRNGRPIPMSVDANPLAERYRDKVIALGGRIPLLTETYALTIPAAIGDHHVVGSHAARRKCLINVPEISIFEYQSGDKIVMACDELWGKLSSNMVADLITQRPGPDVVPAEVSDAVLLTRQALFIPDENVTVAVVDLRQTSEITS